MVNEYEKKRKEKNSLIYLLDALFGFNPINYLFTEGSSGVAEVTIQLFRGSLGRNITLTVQSNDETAMGETYSCSA